MDPTAAGPNPVYEVFNQLGDPVWENQTVIYPGKLGQEFTKTYGHYHGAPVTETYKVVSGHGILLLQKRDLSETCLIKATPGDEISITPDYGHSWSNVGNEKLVTYDDWRAGHSPTDYEFQKTHHGMSYYLIEENGEIKTIPNPNYQNLSAPKWLTIGEFRK